jgi:hypothetical protein
MARQSGTKTTGESSYEILLNRYGRKERRTRTVVLSEEHLCNEHAEFETR